MTPAERDAFLGTARIAKLALLNADGSPTALPIWFEWDGEKARMFTVRGSWKVRRIEGDPRVSLTVETAFGEPEAWVTIEGRAAILPDGGFALAERLLPRYYEPAKAAETAEAWKPVPWVVIEVIPTRIKSSAPES